MRQKINLKNAVAAFSALILPILLFVFSPYWHEKMNPKRSLEYDVLFKSSMGADRSVVAGWEGLEFRYNGDSVSGATVLKVSLHNNGDLPIRTADFEDSIRFMMSNPGSILSVRLAQAEPPDLHVKFKVSPQGVVMEPMLLNPGDLIVFSVLAKADIDLESVATRIYDIQEVKKRVTPIEDGVYVEKVISNGPGSSLHERIIRLPIYMMLAIIPFLFSSFFVVLGLRVQLKNLFAKIVLSVLALCIYLLSIFLFILANRILVQDIGAYMSLALISVFLVVGVLIAAYLRRSMRLVRAA